MIFDWKEYFNLAEQLGLSNPSEAQMRTSISRAYYSVYHKAKLLCLDKLKIVKESDFSYGSDSHKIILDRLISTGDQDLNEIASRLSALKLRRKSADYDSKCEIKSSLVQDTLIKSKTALDLISEQYL